MSVFGGHLYFTNANQNIVARIAIHNNGTSKRSAAEVITHLDSPTGFVYTYVAQHRVNRLGSVSGNIVTTLAPNFTEMEIGLFGCTALAWGRSGKLFISTDGGTAQYLTGVAGRYFRLKLSGNGKKIVGGEF